MPVHRPVIILTAALCALTASILAQDSIPQTKEDKGRIVPPDTAAVMNYGLDMFFGGEYGRFREAKDEKSKSQVAKVLYKNFFILWYATEHSPAKIADFRLRGRIHRFLTGGKEDKGMMQYIDTQDDPFGWGLVDRSNVTPEEMEGAEDLIGGAFPILAWVAQETKDPAAYKEAVSKFRAYLDAVRAEGVK